MDLKRISYWIEDYIHLARGQSYAFIFRRPPKHYLGFVEENKLPIILIPGVFGTWHFLKDIADPLSLNGHPVYILENLGHNLKEIPAAARIVRSLIEKEDIRDCVIVAHSKGGLVGKYVLAFFNRDKRVKKVIAIATPFAGSHIVKLFPVGPLKELLPESEVIKKLECSTEINNDIISIFGIFDNHVWPLESCRLNGARNIQIKVRGHHKILFDEKAREAILSEVGKLQLV